MVVAPAVGIDLGTTNSRVALFQDGGDRVELITNDQGGKVLPSCVTFTHYGRLFGEAAKIQVSRNPSNSLFDAKRFIGHRFDDVTVQSGLEQWPFAVVNDDGKPKIQIEYKDRHIAFCAEEISSMVLLKMKETAERYTNKNVLDAVVTVPATFSNSQRQATKDACAISGLNVLQILNETTSSAIAYYHHNQIQTKQNILIFDLGGGFLDVSIFRIEDNVIEVQSTTGSSEIGGRAFDNVLVNHFIKEFNAQSGKDITGNKRAVHLLHIVCERAKRTLSSAELAEIEVDSLCDGVDFHSCISRSGFEQLCSGLIDTAMEFIDKALSDAGIAKSSLDEILLVGGSSYIPMLQTRIHKYFDGKEHNKSLSADDAVAYGAAVQAAILNGSAPEKLLNLKVIDMAHRSISVETAGGSMTTVINKNTIIPTKEVYPFVLGFETSVGAANTNNKRSSITTGNANTQRSSVSHSTTSTAAKKNIIVPTKLPDSRYGMFLQVYEGEHPNIKDNILLGMLQLTGFPPTQGIPEIDITFDVDASGILDTSAIEKRSKKRITVKMDKVHLSVDNIIKMKKDMEKYKTDDDAQKDRMTLKYDLESHAYQLRSTVQTIGDKCNEVIAWLQENQKAAKEEIERHQEELECVCMPILKLYQAAAARQRHHPADTQ